MTEQRDALGADARARASVQCASRLADLPEFKAAAVVSGFLPIRSEIDPDAALRTVTARGASVVFPRMTTLSPRLRFHRIRGPEDLRLGAYGLREPAATCPEVPLSAIDVVLTPGLAFDARGFRLGYGGGYFDEVATCLRAEGHGVLVGLGFDFQLIDKCPVGDGDVAIDCVVTDARVVRCERP